MSIPFILLSAQTLLFWLIAIVLHRKKARITLIPLYAYIGILTILTHNFSDLGFAVVVNHWYFLIASFSFFTTLMFATLFLYLFEGPRAGRVAIWIILFSSVFYIGLVYLLGLETNTNAWVRLDLARFLYYSWSILAIIADVFFLAIAWELLSRIKSLNLVSRVFLITFGVFALDTAIFTTGAFWSAEFYASMLQGNLITRFVLSLIGAPIIAYFLRSEGFSEEKRNKPKNFWEIFNFRSDLETKIFSLEDVVEKYKILQDKLAAAEETYRLAIEGASAGIWDWDLFTNKMILSPKTYTLLGYRPGEIKGHLDTFKAVLHPADYEKTFAIINQCFKSGQPYETEYRLKTKSGEYRWFLATGITKYDNANKPIRMVGSIIDIDAKKQGELKLQKSIEELTQLNKIMVGRELQMVALKKEISDLKNPK